MTPTPDTVVVPRKSTAETTLADIMERTEVFVGEYRLSAWDKQTVIDALRAASPALSASEPVAYLYERAMGMTVGGEPDCWQTGLTFVNPDRHSGIRNVRPLYTHPAPSVSPSVEEISNLVDFILNDGQYLASTAVNRTPREFSDLRDEIKRRRTQSIAALFEGGKK